MPTPDYARPAVPTTDFPSLAVPTTDNASPAVPTPDFASAAVPTPDYTPAQPHRHDDSGGIPLFHRRRQLCQVLRQGRQLVQPPLLLLLLLPLGVGRHSHHWRRLRLLAHAGRRLREGGPWRLQRRRRLLLRGICSRGAGGGGGGGGWAGQATGSPLDAAGCIAHPKSGLSSASPASPPGSSS